MRKLAIILFLAVAAQAQATVTVVTRGISTGVATFTSGANGNLGTWVAGSWYNRPVGPLVSGDTTALGKGWSMDAQASGPDSYIPVVSGGTNSAAFPAGAIGIWVRFKSFGTGSINNIAAFMKSETTGGDTQQAWGVKSDGTLYIKDSGNTVISAITNPTLALYTWYWFQEEWVNSGNRYTNRFSYKPLGGSLTVVGGYQGPNVATYNVGKLHVCNLIYTANAGIIPWTGRLGGATLYSISALGDLTGPDAALIDPVEEPHNWYLNPATGNDSNDGITPATAWQTLSKFNTETQYSGVLGAATTAAGDIVNIDTSGASLDPGATVMTIRPSGITVQPVAGQTYWILKAEKDVSGANATWTLSSGSTKTYETTDSSATDLTSVGIWEDDKFLNHPTGATFAAVQTSMDSTPGSFYSDGTKIYLHPFGDTNPASDGKIYTRSRYRSDGTSPAPGPGQSAIYIPVNTTESVQVIGARVRKTALWRSSDDDPVLAYGIQIGGSGTGGSVVLNGCYLDYNSKHGLGTTIDGNNLAVTVTNCRVEQSRGNGTPYVDYNGTVGKTGNTTLYTNCSSFTPVPLIGSTTGAAGGTAYISHNSGGSNQFSTITFIGGTYNGAFSVGGSVSTFSISGATFGGNPGSSGQGCLNVAATNCILNMLPLSAGAASSTTTVRNCLLILGNGTFNNNSGALTQGTVIYEGNTFDLTPASSDTADFGIFKRNGALSMTFRDNAVKVQTGKSFTIVENGVNTDTLTFTNNAYQFGAGGTPYVVKNYNDGSTTANRTFTQWQALGKDANSLSVTDLALAANYKPLRGSPVINAGVDLGPLVDYTNRLFAVRNDIGAYEFIPANQSLVRRGGLRR